MAPKRTRSQTKVKKDGEEGNSAWAFLAPPSEELTKKPKKKRKKNAASPMSSTAEAALFPVLTDADTKPFETLDIAPDCFRILAWYTYSLSLERPLLHAHQNAVNRMCFL